MAPDTPAPAAPASPAGSEQKGCILVIEDNPVAQRVLVSTLRRGDFDVHGARNVDDAAVILARKPIDLIILDVQLPGKSGLDFACDLRASPRFEKLPLLFFTATSDKEVIRKAAGLGNVDYLLKPLRAPLLLERVERILGLARVTDSDVAGWVEAPASTTAGLAGSVLGNDGVLAKICVPSFSASAQQMIELVNNPEATVRSFSEVIATDPALSATVLRVANSSYYSRRRKVTSINEACVVIGLHDMSSLCLSAALAQEMTGGAIDIVKECWTHSLCTGALAHRFAETVSRDGSGVIAIAGVMHLIGLVALLGSKDIDYRAVEARADGGKLDWAVAEQEVLGIEHGTVGRIVTNVLRLPERVGEIILACAQPDGVDAIDSWCVAMASVVLELRGEQFQLHADPDALQGRLAARFPDEWRSLADSLDAMVEETRDRHQLLTG